MRNNTPKLLIGGLLLLILNVFTATAQTQVGFKCNSKPSSSSSSLPNATCKAVVGYVSPNATTLSNIATLFGLTDDLRSLLGANSFPINTTPNRPVPAKQTIRIPIICSCINGRGSSTLPPIYKVKAGDGLDHIARNIFSLLVTYQQIAQASGIPDPDKIDVGQEVRIPLPCSCDEVDGVQVVHYGHVVKPDSSVEMIAEEFGTKPETLLKLNGLADSKALKAETVVDVPLKACTSMVSKTSPDYPLLVSDGTYTYTANNCVRCTCDSSRNNGELYCQKSTQDIKPLRWAQCPPTVCSGLGRGPDLGLGISTSTFFPSGCNFTKCAYNGYNSTAISTNLTPETPCPAGTPRPNNAGTKMSLQRSKLLWLLSFALPILSVLLC